MQVRNVTDSQLQAALDAANEQFDGNIRFKRYEYAGQTRAHTNKYTVTLTVKSSRAPGSRINPANDRRISAACWHAHGAFLQALPPEAVVLTSRRLANKQPVPPWHPGDALDDWNCGSIYYPYMMSEACLCDH